jgi:HK97 gp10 family phage protein
MRDDLVSVKTNLADFRAQLKAVGLKMERKIVRAATRDALKIYKAAATRLAPELSLSAVKERRRIRGALKSSIYIGTSRRAPKGTVSMFVGVRAKRRFATLAVDAFYWRFLEGGWMPRGPGRKLTGGVRRRALERERNRARGARFVQRPFLLPAFRIVGTGAPQIAFEARVERELALINASKNA